MTTIVNNPNGGNENNVTGIVVGILVAILIIILVLAFGLPYLRNGGAPAETQDSQAEVNVTLP